MISPGLGQSLAIAVQRRELRAIGEEVGSPVLFLKAAWADPVLYGGRGERLGCDIDVLVEPNRFRAFIDGLSRSGFARIVYPTHPSMSMHAKEASFLAPNRARMPIDLHRSLADWPWFSLPVGPCIQKAVAYPSPDGEILSLCPDDQVLYCAAHCANHALSIDDRHINDVVRLLVTRTVDWDAIAHRARAAGLGLALSWLVGRLRELGAELPPEYESRRQEIRLRLIARVNHSRVFRRPSYKAAAALTLVSTRCAALPLFLLRYGALRAADFGARLKRRCAARSS